MKNPFETEERDAFRETIRRYVEAEITPNVDEWDEAMQILGGAGYMRGNPVERIYRGAKVFVIGGGSEEIMRDLSLRQMGL
ncbi:acyl-CoA dehydrogenase family protein [bacterium]|nr:acyl-CoA dehydrogenase family protein [bacterium]